MAIKFSGNSGGTLKDTLSGDFYIGGRGADSIVGSKGTDHFFTGFGDDKITVGSGNTGIDGGEGRDTVVASGGSWLIAMPSFSHGSTGLVNTISGQAIGLSDVETVKLGSQTVTFNFGTDAGAKFSGTSGMDFIFGRDGNDVIDAGGGDDRISSGNGADTVKAGAGNDIVDDSFATAGPGLYQPKSGTDSEKNTFDLGAGDDIAILNSSMYYSPDYTVMAERATYEIAGGAGLDAVMISGFFAQSGGDPWSVKNGAIVTTDFFGNTKTFAKLSGVEQVVDTYNDRVWNAATGLYERASVSKTGTAQSEKVVGGSSNDTLKGNGGFDYFTGDKGTDTVELSGVSAFWHGSFAGSTVQTKNGFTGARLDNLNDKTAAVLAADVEKIKFLGAAGSGDDTVFNFKIVKTSALASAATAANDFIVVTKGAAADKGTLSAGAGNDHVIGEGSLKSFNGGTGDDILEWRDASNAAVFRGEAGNDQISVYSTSAKTSATIEGGAGDDALSLLGLGTVKGGVGDDQITVGDGAKAYGEDGNDVFSGGAFSGKSTADGGKGEDAFDGYDVSTNYRITATAKGIVVTSKADGGSLTLTSVEAMRFADVALDTHAGTKSFTSFNGAGKADTKVGGSGIDLMNGGEGNDKLSGAGGNDVLAGDGGSDGLSGGAGDDVLDGGAGNDTLAGGSGFDTFLFLDHALNDKLGFGADKVQDFSAGKGLGDVLVFSLENAALNSFQDVMAHATQTGAGTLITLDADSSVLLASVQKSALAADDFTFL